MVLDRLEMARTYLHSALEVIWLDGPKLGRVIIFAKSVLEIHFAIE